MTSCGARAYLETDLEAALPSASSPMIPWRVGCCQAARALLYRHCNSTLASQQRLRVMQTALIAMNQAYWISKGMKSGSRDLTASTQLSLIRVTQYSHMDCKASNPEESGDCKPNTVTRLQAFFMRQVEARAWRIGGLTSQLSLNEQTIVSAAGRSGSTTPSVSPEQQLTCNDKHCKG